VLRFANADVLPYSFKNFADSIRVYVSEVAKLTDDMREQSTEKNRRIADNTFTAVSDPTQPYVVSSPDAPVPYLNFAPLQNSLARLQQSAQTYDARYAAYSRAQGEPTRTLTPQMQQALDQALKQTERAMLSEQGLPRRPWFKHQIYAPGFYTGYGVKTLPAVREAIEQRNWPEAEQQIKLVAETINQIAAAIDRATAQLK
jgi:N-acetylated-alpha-linked acidic dipeptidase